MSPQTAVDWWPMFQHDPAHSGYSSSAGPSTNETLWNFTTGYFPSSPAVVNGVAYFTGGSSTSNVYALNATTGVLLWNSTTTSMVGGIPAIDNSLVYVASEKNVEALNASTGSVVWNYQTEGPYTYGGAFSPTVVGGVLYVGGNYQRIYAFNATTGIPLWSYLTNGGVASSPTVVDGRLYAGEGGEYEADNVYCLNASTGEKLWNYSTGFWVGSSATVYSGVVYIGSEDNSTYALNATTGALIWNFTTGGFVDSSPAVLDGIVYFGSYDNRTYALNATTGALIWNFTTGGWVASSPTIAAGVVYIGSGDGKLYALNMTTGVYIWSYQTGRGRFSESYGIGYPASIVNGILYVGSADGQVYAIGSTTNNQVAVTNASISKTVIGRGYCANVSITVSNSLDVRADVNVSLFCSNLTGITRACPPSSFEIPIGTVIANFFEWNTSGLTYGNYNISASLSLISNGTAIAQYNYTCGEAVITISGDLNGDFKVNLSDLVLLANAYGSKPGDTKWNPNADINGDGKVSLADLVILANHYGQHYP